MTDIRHDWIADEIQALFDLSFADLMFQAQEVHRANFDPNEVQVSTLLNIKSGACPEDCCFCSQSGLYNTDIDRYKVMSIEDVLDAAKRAKSHGATRFCMVGAWRGAPEKDMPRLVEMVEKVKELGLETCLSTGFVTPEQAKRFKDSGLDYYNHNIESSPEHYEKTVTTHTFADRINTVNNVREAGIKVCCGGLLGMGETEGDRIELLRQLANMPEHPQSLPINSLIRVRGTPYEDEQPIDPVEFARIVAVARVMMPKSKIRLSGGRADMSPELQTLCFLAGANSIHYGEKLLTTPNAKAEDDVALFNQLGITSLPQAESC